MELESGGLIYRILANPFISGLVEDKIDYKGARMLPARQRLVFAESH
jgi:hypothetical protein